MTKTGTEQLDPIRTWAQAINTVLSSYRTLASAASDHGGIIGETREFFVREILRRFLPPSVEIGTGQIVDSDRGLSKQIDIIVSRYEYPILTSLAASDVFLAESIIAAIEVKSSLTGGEMGSLWEALDNCRSVKQRKIKANMDSVKSYLKKANRQPSDTMHVFTKLLPPTYIFGYQGYKKRLSDLKQAFFHWVKERETPFIEFPDVIVTEGCVVIKNNGEFINQDELRNLIGYDCISIARKDKESLTWLLWHLLKRIIDCLGEVYHAETGIRYISGDQYIRGKFLAGEWETWGKRSANDDQILTL